MEAQRNQCVAVRLPHGDYGTPTEGATDTANLTVTQLPVLTTFCVYSSNKD